MCDLNRCVDKKSIINSSSQFKITLEFINKHFSKNDDYGLTCLSPIMCMKRRILTRYLMNESVKHIMNTLDNMFDKEGCPLRRLIQDDDICTGCNHSDEIKIYGYNWRFGVNLCGECKRMYDNETEMINEDCETEGFLCMNNRCGHCGEYEKIKHIRWNDDDDDVESLCCDKCWEEEKEI